MIKKLFLKYKEIILYVFFGVCTTLVNILAYFISTRYLQLNVMPSTIIAWILAVIFAYLTNRKYVFRSQHTAWKSLIIEFSSFISSRLLTGFLDIAIMYIFVNKLGLHDVIVKICSNLIVIVSNYVISKLWIFKNQK